MVPLRLALVPRLLLSVWAVCALLPPGAWALCLGSQGHVAFEPAGIECREEAAHAAEEVACEAADCGTCVDVPLLSGVAIKHSKPQIDAAYVAIGAGPIPVVADPAPGFRVARRAGSMPLSGPTLRGVFLRC